jgi:hypothetical protein
VDFEGFLAEIGPDIIKIFIDEIDYLAVNEAGVKSELGPRGTVRGWGGLDRKSGRDPPNSAAVTDRAGDQGFFLLGFEGSQIIKPALETVPLGTLEIKRNHAAHLLSGSRRR